MTRSPRGPYFRKTRNCAWGCSPCASRTLNPWIYPSLSRMRAISTLSRDDGISTRACRAMVALRMRDSMSAIGSVINLDSSCQLPVPSYQFPVIRGFGSVLSGWKLAPGNWKLLLPATLRHPCDVALERQLAEAEAAESELAQVGTRPAASLAAVAEPDLVLRDLGFLGDLRSRGHDY